MKASKKTKNGKQSFKIAVAKASLKPAAKKAPIKKTFPGFRASHSGNVIIPTSFDGTFGEDVVKTSRLQAGIRKAKDDIASVIREVFEIATAEYYIESIDISLSFSADGKFMGVGVGGATSVRISVKPGTQDES